MQDDNSKVLGDLSKARKSMNDLLGGSEPLRCEDYELIGRFVQAYCVADLQARWAINALSQARTGLPTDFALKLNDADVIKHLRIGAQEWEGQPEVGQGLLMVADILGGHRHLRHMFAHWAVRRVPSHDALICFTASMGGQKIPEGAVIFEEVEGANLKYGIVPVGPVKDELGKMEGHAQYLTNICQQLMVKAGDLAEEFRVKRAPSER